MSLEEMKPALENALKAFNEYKGVVETIQTKTNTLEGKLDALDLAKFDKIEKAIGDAVELNQKTEARAKALEDNQKALEAALNRGPLGSVTDEKATRIKFKKAINAFARKDTGQSGKSQLYFDDFVKEEYPNDVELKALSVGTDPNGGYLVTPEMGGIISTKVYESSPMRALASVQQIGSLAYEYIIDNDEAGSGWAGETSSRPTTNTPTLGKITITAHELYANPKATQTVLDDASIDMEAWLAGKVAEKFARDEATAFVTGNGIAKPRGIMSYTSGTDITAEQVEQVNSGSASTFTYAGLVDLQNALKEPYQGNARFLIRRASNAFLLKLVDGEGRPIFNMSYDKNAGLEPTIMGKPVSFAADVAAVASNALAMAYGDFRAAYLIVDRIGLRVLRDPYTDKPYVSFYTTKRVGGAVINFEALKIQKISS
ncbi:phage major capsid protein [Gemmata sp. G18]|uniref:Phage major capsid protein n=1 Tax=Gemmata palustris TaxID=2822762 RepID=A0ABS5BX74_9BACT|nr:phage major capsid protein [Gemmata palustris]MBP3958351.1 phage major capsid protein [Gemmata palustris]